jgi:drug/metabolite transporter (DMT)-like permease
MRRGIIFALIAATFYGLNIVFACIATKAGIPPSHLVVYRILFLLVICVPFLRKFTLTSDNVKMLLPLSFASALVGFAYFTSVSYITVSEAAPIFYTFPLWILLLSPIILKTKPDNRLYWLFALAFIGLCLIIGFSFKLPDYRGVIAALVASLCATTQFFTAKRASEGLAPITVIVFVNGVILPLVLAFAYIEHHPVNVDLLLIVPFSVFMVCAAYAIGFALQMQASKITPPAILGLVFCLEPVVAMIASSILLGEGLGGVQLIGAACVIIALVSASILQIKRA